LPVSGVVDDGEDVLLAGCRHDELPVASGGTKPAPGQLGYEALWGAELVGDVLVVHEDAKEVGSLEACSGPAPHVGVVVVRDELHVTVGHRHAPQPSRGLLDVRHDQVAVSAAYGRGQPNTPQAGVGHIRVGRVDYMAVYA